MKLQTLSDSQNLNSEIRPWGRFREIFQDDTINIKILEVNPTSRLSLQSHKYRSEHWIVQHGTAKVQINDLVKTLDVNDTVFIPQGAKHRLENPSKNHTLVILEIQQGSSFDENDITRYSDDYNRS